MKTPVISTFRSTFCVAMLGVLLAPNASAQRGSAGGAIGGLVVGVQGGVYSQQQRPTGTVTGFILDDRGFPATGVMVHALSESTARDGTRRTNAFGSRPTDADGRFRIDNLRPGQYFVAAAPMPMARPTADSTALGITYYPGVFRQQEAQSVSVSDGGEQAIIIQLQRVQTFHIRGTVSSSTGRSPVGLSVQLGWRIGNSSFGQSGGQVQADGTFDILGVTPGTYSVSAQVGNGNSVTEFAHVGVEVVDHDVEGITLAMGTGGSVSGRIVFQGGSPGPAPLGVNVTASPAGPMSGPSFRGSFGSTTVAEDWTFRLRGLSGILRFTLPMNALSGYRLVQAVFDGREIGTTGIRIVDGDHQLIFYLAPR